MSFPSYPEYKESGLERLGFVPIHWALYSLKRSVEGCVNGIWGDEADGENDLAVIRVADFQRSKLRIGTKKLTYRSITNKEKEARKLRIGDLLIEKSGGGDKTLVGCVVLFEHDFGAVSSNFVARMRPLPNFDSNFLCYAFDSLYKGRVNYPSIKQTTGIQNLDSESYLQERFCFPSLTEQTKIARFLDHETAKIDTLIHEQKRLIELLKEKRQAVISHAVTKGLDPDVPMKDSGVEWLGEVPAHWGLTCIKHCCYVNDGNHGEEYPKGDDFIDGDEKGIPFIRGGNLKNMTVSQEGMLYITPEKNQAMRKGRLLVGDILFVNRGEIGKLAVVPPSMAGANLNSQIAYLRVTNSRIEPSFLVLYLTSDTIKALIEAAREGSVLTQYPIANLVSIRVPVPPKDEQKKIADFLSKELHLFNTLKSEGVRNIALLQERRSALISAAVTGKIDVRNWQPPADESAFDGEVRQAGMETTA